MSSTSERGHAKNVANFTDLLAVCNGFGNQYNPANPLLTVTALGDLNKAAEAAQRKLNNAMPPYTTTVAAKDEAFAPLSKFVTRVIAAFRSCKPMEGELQNAETIARKVKGETAGKKPAKEGEATVSTAQMSMDMRIENLSRLTEILAANPKYAPNEAELQVTSINTMIAKLKTLSEEVVKQEIPVKDARAQRNKLLYTADTGLVAIAEDAKQYVKSVFGAGSPQYKQVSKISFTKARL